MKRFVLSTIIIAMIFSQECLAGGLNRIGGIGSRAGAMSGAFIAISDDSTLFYYNPAGMSQFGTTYVDAGLDMITPRYDYNGHHSRNNKWYPLPYAGIIYPVNEKLNVGLGLTVPYGLGASFEKNWPLPESETLVSLTNITPALSLRITDNFYLGAGLNIGYGQFKYKAPFDINGFFTPIKTDNEAEGFGLGATFGLMYYPTEKLSIGLSYMSEMKVNLKGESDIAIGPFQIHDQFQSDLTFPSQFGLGVAYRLTHKLTVEFDANWYGYSKTVDSVTLDFSKLPFQKTTKLDWRDNYGLRLGTRYRLNDDWWLRNGFGYMTKAIPDSTISQLTPDVNGWVTSLSIECQKDHFSSSVAAIYSWGSNEVPSKFGVMHPGKYRAETLTLAAQIGWQF